MCGRVSTSKLCMDKLCCMHVCMYACMYVWMDGCMDAYIYICIYICIYIYMYQGSDKGGGVVQMVLVDTERNAQGAQLQNASACTFFSATK